MPLHEVSPEHIDVTKIMSNHVEKSVIWYFHVAEMDRHNLLVRGHLNSVREAAELSVVDLQAKISLSHLKELDLHEFDEDLDTAMGARNALAAAFNRQFDVHSIPGLNQLPLPLGGK